MMMIKGGVLVLLFLASVEAEWRLGVQWSAGKKCSGDPSQWCDSLRTAHSCQALSYCLSRVWERQRVPVEQTKECRYGQKMVKLIQKRIAKAIDPAQARASFLVASMCTVIHDDSTRKQCKELVTDFTPQLLKLMNSSVEPSTTATLMGLCHPAEKRTPGRNEIPGKALKFEKEQKKPVGDSTECELCKFLVKYIDSYLMQNKTEEEIKGFLEDICRKLPAGITPQCLSFVDEYAAMVVQILVQMELDPNTVCDTLKLCSSSAASGAHKLAVPSKTGSEFCTVCEVLVGILETQLEKNKTEAEIEKYLDDVCSRLPSTESGVCKLYVKTYVPALIALLAQELPPQEVCQKIGLCNATVSVAALKVTAVNPVDCNLCKVIFSEVDRLLGDNASEQAIIHTIEKVCDFFQGDFQLECKSEVENYGPAVLDLLKHMDDPGQICSSLKLCTSAPSVFSLHRGDDKRIGGPRSETFNHRKP